MTGKLTRGVMWDIKTSHYLKKRPDRPFARFLAGWAALSLGGAQKAAEFFGAALELDPGYPPAYVGLACCEMARGKFKKAAGRLALDSAKLGLASKVGMCRACGAVSVTAVTLMKKKRRGGALGAFSRAGHFFADALRRETRTGGASGEERALSECLGLIRYAELALRGGAPSKERLALAAGVCALPGLIDEFRLLALGDAEGAENARLGGVESAEAARLGGVEFAFDNPVIFPKPLLNSIFREKINSGELRAPRVILANLRRDSAQGNVDNVNKWLFLRLCSVYGRRGQLESETALELERCGWWADPVVRAFLRGRGPYFGVAYEK